MDETNHATSGFSRITGRNPAARLHLGGLVLTALLGSVLVIWVSRTTWGRLDHLQREYAGLKANSFYLGVHMRDGIERLNDTLLRYRLRGDPADNDLFYTDSRQLTDWFEAGRTNAATPLEHQFFEQVGSAYYAYLAESTNMLRASLGWFQTKAGAFPASYEKVKTDSQHLLNLCDAFIQEQSSAFDDFVKESSSSLTMFQRLLKISEWLVLTLAAALVVLAYRGMIAPLRLRLTETEAIIARQEKLASLGVLAAGVAHEIRNPLTAIKFRLFSLKKSLPGGGDDNEDALVIGKEISRLERIVKDFLLFARPSEPELVVLPVQRVMQEVLELLKPQFKKKAVQLNLEPSKPAWVRADTQQIKQVLINLIQNSADSIQRDGEITLRVRAGSGPSRNGAGEFVLLEVSDTGKGIPPEVQQRLFDPFFTTKEGGSGLGLPIAARIVEKHGGELRFKSRLNHGTTFTILLPKASENES